MRSKADRYFWGWEMEEEDGELTVGRRMENGGCVTVWMEATGDGGAAGAFDAEALGADGDPLIGADFGLGTLAPDVGPPRAVWSGAEDGALLRESKVPGGLRGGAQFAVEFFLVVVKAEFFEQKIGLGQRGDVLCGEEWREAFLPEVVGAFDLAFGLRSGRVAQGDFVEAQGGAELSESVGRAGKEEGMIVDVEGEREAVGAEGAGEEVEMGVEVFAFVEAGTRDDSAVVVDDFEEGRLALLAVEPAVGRSVILPELADVLDLPAADRAGRFFAQAERREAFPQSPATHRGAVDGEVMAAQRFGSGEAVGTRRRGREELAQGGGHGLRQRRAMVAARRGRAPGWRAAFGTGGEIGGVDLAEASAAKAEFGERMAEREFPSAIAAQHIANKGRGMAQVELPVVFIPPTWPVGGRERMLASASATLRLRPACANPPRPPLIAHCPGLNAHRPGLIAPRQRAFSAPHSPPTASAESPRASP